MGLFSLRHEIYRSVEKWYFGIRVAGLRKVGVEIHYPSDLQLIGLPRLKLAKHSALKIGAQCLFRSSSDSNPIGIDQPVTFCTLAPNAKIVIGNNVGISGGTICSRQYIEIGAGTLIGANSYIFDNDFHPIDPHARHKDDLTAVGTSPVRIGCNVFLGARSIVLKGVTIGDNAVIGAGSVVTRSIPANTIAGGNPCKVRGQLQLSGHGA